MGAACCSWAPGRGSRWSSSSAILRPHQSSSHAPYRYGQDRPKAGPLPPLALRPGGRIIGRGPSLRSSAMEERTPLLLSLRVDPPTRCHPSGAGMQHQQSKRRRQSIGPQHRACWIPACAGMTVGGGFTLRHPPPYLWLAGCEDFRRAGMGRSMGLLPRSGRQSRGMRGRSVKLMKILALEAFTPASRTGLGAACIGDFYALVTEMNGDRTRRDRVPVRAALDRSD